MKTRYPLLIASMLFVLAGLHASTSRGAPPPSPMGEGAKKPALKKRKPVTCGRTQDIELDRVLIEGSGPAAMAMGSCDLIIKNSVIRTTGTALVVKGSGDITLINTTVESKRTALLIKGSGDLDVHGSRVTGDVAAMISGSGDLEAAGTHFRGKKIIRGTGEYEDKGGNTWE